MVLFKANLGNWELKVLKFNIMPSSSVRTQEFSFM